MKSAGSSVIAALIAVAVAGLLTTRSVEAGDDRGISKQLNHLQKTIDSLTTTVNSFKIVLDGIKADISGEFKVLDGLELLCKSPDLVPLLPRCEGELPEVTLHVPIYNQGGGTAGPSTTFVDFGAFGQLFLPTDQLVGFTATELQIAIPPSCFSHPTFPGTCKFLIFADFPFPLPPPSPPLGPFGAVAESHEDNNSLSGDCFRGVIQ